MRGPPRVTGGGDQPHVGRIDLLNARNAHRPEQPERRQALPERRADAVAGIGQHRAEAHAGLQQPLEFLQRDLRLRARRPERLGHAGALQALRILDPGVGQKQPQDDRDRHLIPGQRQRDQRLAVGVLAQSAGILRADADRMRALLGQRRVVDHQDGVGPADEPVGLGQEFGFQRRLVPRADRHEVVQLIVVGRSHPSRHRLQALALAGADQPGHIERAHAPARRVTQRC